VSRVTESHVGEAGLTPPIWFDKFGEVNLKVALGLAPISVSLRLDTGTSAVVPLRS
jgi:hypothetical protein